MKIKIKFPYQEVVNTLNEHEGLVLTVEGLKKNKPLLAYLKNQYMQDLQSYIEEGFSVYDGWNNDAYSNVHDYII